MAFPKEGEDISSLTGIKITQALSENFAVYFGKLNTLDEYVLHYDRKLGLAQPGLGGFMNTSLVFNPILARTVPYSAIAVGAAVLRKGEPVFAFTVFDPRERATIGFQDPYAEGAVFAPELVLKTRFFGRPGLWDLGGTYSTAEYRSVDPSAYLIVPGQGLPAPQERGSWALYANGYQAIWVDPCDEGRNWGLFTQFGVSDGNPNPIQYAVVAGLTGRSMLPGRPIDTFGAGFFYLGLSDEFKALTAAVVPQDDEYGVELFYNYAITPWSRFTVDLQIARPSTQAFDTVVIPGIRLQIIF
jgi:porin